MPSEKIDEGLLLEYLLGNLPEAEQARVENRAFTDAEYCNALEASESDLIDTYVRGGLSPADRRAFERQFLTSPNRRRKVEFAKVLAKVSAESSLGERKRPRQLIWSWIRGWAPPVQFAAALAASLLVAVPSWLALRNAEMQARVISLERNEKALRRQIAEEQSRATAPPRPQQPLRPVIASLVLLPGLSRTETRVEQLLLPPGAQIARIEIPLTEMDVYPQYRVELRTQRGEDVLAVGGLKRRQTSSGYAVSFDAPASSLTIGEYELTLKGVRARKESTDIGYFYFGVRKQL